MFPRLVSYRSLLTLTEGGEGPFTPDPTRFEANETVGFLPPTLNPADEITIF